MKKYIKWIIIVLAIIGIVLIVLKVRKNSGAVVAEKVEPTQTIVKKSVSASGEVKSRNQANLAFTTLGKIEGIYVEEGDKVTAGTLLAYISNGDAQQAAQSAKKTFEAAEKDLQIYRENYATNYNAVGGLDEYKLNMEKLQKLIEKAEAGYQSSLLSLDKTRMYAPFDGTILDVYKEEDETASIGETIIKIANTETEYFEILVDQEDYGLVQEGQEVDITLDSYEDRVFTAHVTDFARYIDEATNDFVVKINFDEIDKEAVIVGMEGDAKITVDKTDSEVVALVFDQIFSSNGNSYVWIEEGGNLKKLPVEIGLEGDIYTEVKTDLSNKTIVVPIQTENVEEGQKVIITN